MLKCPKNKHLKSSSDLLTFKESSLIDTFQIQKLKFSPGGIEMSVFCVFLHARKPGPTEKNILY